MLPSVLDLCADVGDTPVRTAAVRYRGHTGEVLLKQESANPTGSVKDRTAAGLLRALDRVETLRPGTVVVESTSGNLGMALARLLTALDCRLIAVVDPKTPEPTRRALAAAGAELRMVTEPDGFGGYLITRLRAVAELRRAHPGHRWTDQYGNPANPLIHQETTGPEIVRQGGPALDAVYVAVSTGGTLAGVSAHLRDRAAGVRMVAVDLRGSMAVGPAAGTRRLIPGIGASRPSSFLRPGSYDRAVPVADADAIAMCRILAADTGLTVGGSTGCVLAACVQDLPTGYARRPLCLCPDDGTKYADTLYDDGWLRRGGVLADVQESIARFRRDDLAYRLEPR